MRPITRRRLLERSGYSALGVLASSNAWLLQGCASSDGKWASLAKQLDGRLLRPGDAAYSTTGLTENTVANDAARRRLLCAPTLKTCRPVSAGRGRKMNHWSPSPAATATPATRRRRD